MTASRARCLYDVGCSVSRCVVEEIVSTEKIYVDELRSIVQVRTSQCSLLDEYYSKTKLVNDAVGHFNF